MSDVSEIEALVKAAETIQKIVPLDCGFMVCDSEGIIIKYVSPKTFNLNAKEGAVIAKGGTLGECLSTGKPVQRTLSKESYGIPIKSSSFPIYEDGKLIGGISTAISLANQQSLMEAAQTIAATSQQMAATTEELAATATHLSEGLTTIGNVGANIEIEVKNTDEILRFVSDIAANSNLLGLNAAIEAARAGEHGK